MAGKFLPLDDHDDDEEDSLLDASVRVERFERKVMGRAWAACAILSLTFAGVALYRHMSAAPAVGSSLIAFIIVYFTVFTAGVIYILRLMAQPPHPGEQGPAPDLPARAAGITPAAGAAVEGAR